MEYRAKQRIQNRRILYGREALKEVLRVLSYQENANQKDPEIPPYTNQNMLLRI